MGKGTRIQDCRNQASKQASKQLALGMRVPRRMFAPRSKKGRGEGSVSSMELREQVKAGFLWVTWLSQKYLSPQEGRMGLK